MAEPENEFSLRNAILGPERTSVPEPVVGMAELVGGPEQWGQDFKAGMKREFPLYHGVNWAIDMLADTQESFPAKYDAIRSEARNHYPPKEGYDPINDSATFFLPIHLMEYIWDSKSPAETQRIIQLLRKTAEKQENLKHGGLAGTLGMATGIVLSELMLLKGTWGKLAFRTPPVIAANEWVLQSHDPTRTDIESILNVGIGTAIPTAVAGLGATINTMKGISAFDAVDIANNLTDQINLTRTGRSKPYAASRFGPEDEIPLDAPSVEATQNINEATAAGEKARSAFTALQKELKNPDDINDIRQSLRIYTESLLESNPLVVREAYRDEFLRDLDHWRGAVEPLDNKKFVQAIDQFESSVLDLPIAFKQSTEKLQVNAKAINSVDDAMEVTDDFLLRNIITEQQSANIKAVLRIMPDELFRDARLGGDVFSPQGHKHNTGGLYNFVDDTLLVFGHPIQNFTKKLPHATAGHVFAHEVSHRVMYTMMDDAQILEARNLFAAMGKRDQIPDQTSDFIKNYSTEEHFSEWFADEMGGYWVRLARDGKAGADEWLEKGYGDKGKTLSQIFNDILDRLIAFVLRLSGDKDFSRTLTSNQMLDNYFSKLIKNITEKDRAELSNLIKVNLNKNQRMMAEGTDRGEIIFGEDFGPNWDSLNINAAYGGGPPKKPVFGDFDPSKDNSLISAAFLEKLPDSPAKRLLMSTNAFTRHVASYLIEHPFYQNKNALEAGGQTVHGVDRNISINWVAPMVDALKATDQAYFKYRQRFFNERAGTTGVPAHESNIAQGFYDFVGDRAGALTRAQFYDEVGKAKRRLSDPDPQGLPEAYEAARLWHESLYKPALKAAREERMFSVRERRQIDKKREKIESLEATKGGMNRNQIRLHTKLKKEIKELEVRVKEADAIPDNDDFLNRLWNISAIKANPQKFEQIIMERGGYNRAEARARMRSIVEGEHFRDLEPGDTGVARSLKKREIEVDDIYMEEFLESNIGHLGRYYATRMGADIELTRQFGSIDMAEVLAEVRKQAGTGKNARKQLENDERDLLALRDRIRGTYGIPENPDTWTHRGIRIAKMFNATTLLTGALAAVPDMAKLVMTDGFTNTMRMSLETFKHDLSLLKLAKRDANLAGEAVDMYLAMRSALFADLADSLSAATPFERRAGQLTQQFFNLSLMNQWNEFAKTLASLFTGSRIIQNADKLARGVRLSKTELTKMNNVGIGPDEARIITEQVNKHGLKGEHVRIGKAELWDATPEVQRVKAIYIGALGKDINRTIVTPGKGDAPLIMSKPLATLIFQFKTFAIASTHRTLVPGMQLRDRNFLTGAIGLVGLGIMVDQIRRWQNDDTREQAFSEWLGSGIERSGILGYFTDINRAIEVLSDGRLGLPAMFNENTLPSSTLNKLSVIGGPLVQQVGKAADVLWDVTSGDVDGGTVRNGRDLLMTGNVFWTDGLFDYAEEGLGQAFE